MLFLESPIFLKQVSLEAMMEKREWLKIILEGFTTYRETTILGPLTGLFGIFGKNGSGKTNIIKALEFLFDSNQKNDIFNQLFSKIRNGDEFGFIKVGLIFEKKKKFEFVKITDYSKTTEYFLNKKKISSKHFTYHFSKLKFDKFKKLISIIKTNNFENFFNPTLIYKLIKKFSNSNANLFEILKTNFLEQKIEENFFFYSKKLKFIINKKNIY